jgi:23S rRNA (cytosine1962-C5)-methyltransferase
MQALLDAIARAGRPVDAQRIFHGRGGLFPGCEHLALDAYPPVWLLTSFQPLGEEELAQVHTALEARWGELAPGEPLSWVYQCRFEGRSETRLMAGSVPEPHVVTEQGARYLVHLLRGQNHGLFLDMAEGRAWVRQYAAAHPGLKVLNLFAYTCAFSVAALLGGARQVLNLDMSQSAIGTGQQNHALNGLQGRASFLAHDLFKTWGKITRGGPYGLIVVDPPSYQKGSFVASKDYVKLMRRLPDLLVPGGLVLICLNAPELGPEFLQQLMGEAAPELIFEQRLPNPPAFADAAPERALKVLVYRAPTLAEAGLANDQD